VSHPDLAGIRAVVFDAYGTLFDVASPVARAADVLGDRAPGLAATWRQKQLSATWLLSLMGVWTDFLAITRDALDAALAAHRVADPALRDRLLDGYRTLDAFPEVPAALDAVRGRGLMTAILSNGTAGMLDTAVAAAGLVGRFDAVLSVDALRIYKPHPSVYRLACDRLGLPPEAIAFVSSNDWDVAGAGVFGFRTVWVNRSDGRPDPLPGRPAAEIASLDELPALLTAVA
jgi:2-haloacid dehalogenase